MPLELANHQLARLWFQTMPSRGHGRQMGVALYSPDKKQHCFAALCSAVYRNNNQKNKYSSLLSIPGLGFDVELVCPFVFRLA